MLQYESVPNDFSRKTTSKDALLELEADNNGETFTFSFECLRPNLFRTTFTSKSHPLPPYPSTQELKSQVQDCHVELNSQDLYLTTSDLIEAHVNWEHSPIVSLKYKSSDVLHSDLPFRGYCQDGSGVARYTVYDSSALHVGLGEKAAPMDLSGRSFELRTTDAFGYDAHRTDPLYKHIPLLITARPSGCVAQFSASHSRGFWSIGSEIDGLWGPYKVYRQDHGGLEEYLIVGKTLREVLRTYASLVGMPLLVPRWAFGYIAGGYKYTSLDEPPANEALMDFAAQLKEHDIPCSGFQMSSGYHVAAEEPKVRNVFHWNRHRFPDPEGWIKKYHEQGIRLLANVKPFLLKSHPDFQRLLDGKAFFTNPRTGDHGFTRLWSNGGGESGEGCHLDFTSEAARQFWYNGIQYLRKQGIDVAWNDNNEYIIPSDDWLIRRDSTTLPRLKSMNIENSSVGLWGRAMQTELMGKASHDALVDLDPDRRPFVLTRSATAGTMRYCCSTWSGDNVTAWDSMKGSTAMSISQGLSLLQCAGHDVGGFKGPQPTPEMLVRWTQLATYSPRFAINSWKSSPSNNRVGEVIEPWMHPEATPLVRETIKRRYELIPLLYSLSLESHLTASPPLRWTGWGYESDPEVWTPALKSGESQFWLGDTLLVSGVFEPGKSEARVYLPKAADELPTGFWDVNKRDGKHYNAGQWVDIDSPWRKSIPVLAKWGGAVPVGKPLQTKSPGETSDPTDMPKDDYRGVEIYPPPKGVSSPDIKYRTSWLEDDGISSRPDISRFYIEYSCGESEIRVHFWNDASNVFQPDWKELHVITPSWETRKVVGYNGSRLASSTVLNGGGRKSKLA